MVIDELRAFGEGDNRLAALFLEEYGGYIRHAVASVAGRDDDIEELFRETVAHIFTKRAAIIGTFKEESLFSTFLHVVCRRFALRRILKMRRTPGTPRTAISFDTLPEHLLTDHGDEKRPWDDLKPVLAEALEKLSGEDQLLIRMLVMDERPVEEVMRHFALGSTGSVYARKSRALTILRSAAERIMRRDGQAVPA